LKKTLLKKTYILQYIIYWLNRYTHLSVTEYIK
jgi:hypothetical protein